MAVSENYARDLVPAEEFYVIDFEAKRRNDEEESDRPSNRARRCEAYGPFYSFKESMRWATTYMRGEVCIASREITPLVLGDRFEVPEPSGS